MKRTPLMVAVMIPLAVICCLGGRSSSTQAGPRTPRLKPSKAVIGYFPSWNRSVFDYTKISYESLTHIANAFAMPDADGNLVLPQDYVYPALNQTAHLHGVKVILSLGGWGNCKGFAPTAADSAKRTKFIGQVVDFCRDQDYDGADIDWEFVSTSQESADFTLFIKELSTALRAMKPPRQLTMAAPADAYNGQWIDFETLTPTSTLSAS